MMVFPGGIPLIFLVFVHNKTHDTSNYYHKSDYYSS